MEDRWYVKRKVGKIEEEEGESRSAFSFHDMEVGKKELKIGGNEIGNGITGGYENDRGKEKIAKERKGEDGDVDEGIEYWLVYDALSF